jgi:transposase-like protein
MNKEDRKLSLEKSQIVKALPKACMDETAAVEFLEKQRWGDLPACPHCGSIAVVKMLDDKTKQRNKRFLWYCTDCHKQYTVRIGTVFEDSRIPLRHWCYAFWAACSHKKGVSALQISRECQISYKSALFLMHRIRYAMTSPVKTEKLKGIIEADETYVGGKPRIRNQGKSGRGTKKTPILAMVERNGNIRARVIPNVTAKTLKEVIEQEVDIKSRLMTDEFISYRRAGRPFAGGHHVVNHGRKEYARGDVCTNTAESFFAVLKRGIYGTFHAVSKKHLNHYVNEFAFRWDTRKMNDGLRVVKAIKGAEGKRLMYREPVARSA